MKNIIPLLLFTLWYTGAVSAQTQPIGGVSTGEAKSYTTRRTTGIIDEKAPRIYEDKTAGPFVGNYGIPRLYRNNGNGTFTDIVVQAGLAINGWHTGATFGDHERDGLLDLFEKQ